MFSRKFLTNYKPALRDMQIERRPQLHCGRNLGSQYASFKTTVLTRARCLFLSWARIQFTPSNPISWRSVLILSSKWLVTFRYSYQLLVTCRFLYGGELLAPRLIPKLEGHTLPAVRDYLFNRFTATFHIWRTSAPSATSGRAMPWLQRFTNAGLTQYIRQWFLSCQLL